MLFRRNLKRADISLGSQSSRGGSSEQRLHLHCCEPCELLCALSSPPPGEVGVRGLRPSGLIPALGLRHWSKGKDSPADLGDRELGQGGRSLAAELDPPFLKLRAKGLFSQLFLRNCFSFDVVDDDDEEVGARDPGEAAKSSVELGPQVR